jgi:CubicO group peptidase (beta-lactamase class C family)
MSKSVGLKMSIRNIDQLDAIIGPMLSVGRIPGAAIAVVAGDEIVFARGYGYRDLETKLPVTPDTVYPIASTTKAINATMLGILVDEGLLAWDAPVQYYLPRFRIGDSFMSSQITVRDLLLMRTGLPRHDWLWIENPISRAELVERLRYLDLTAGLREHCRYNNLTHTAAGHIAEIVSAKNWNDLVQQKILTPLGMSNTGFTLPKTDNVSLSYHENSRRELILTKRLSGEVTAPSGGSIHSTVMDMARWVSFNLRGGEATEGHLIAPQTLATIQSPQMLTSMDQGALTPNAAYGLGWFIDTYNGRARVSHGGDIHDVNSNVMLFPEEGAGIVSFINFGRPQLTSLINQYAFDLIMDLKPVQTLEEILARYEKRIEDTRERVASVRRVENTSPSHSLSEYAGIYGHPAYGKIEIHRQDQDLVLQRNDLILPLQHWHYDAWVAKDNDIFPIDYRHAFERTNRILFETSADGEIAAVSIQLEIAVAPIRFIKRSATLP